MVEQLMAAGLLGPEEAKRLLDFPDLDRELALDRAASDNIDRIIERMVDDGVYEAPEPFMDLILALKKTQAAYNKAVNDSVPEDRLSLMRQFMASIHEMMKRAQEEARNATAAPAPGAPPAPGPNGAAVTALGPEDGNVALA